MSQYPLIIDAQTLSQHLDDDKLLIIELCKRDIYIANHIPGAVHFDYGHIVKVEKPVMGLVPDDEHLRKVFSALGISVDTHVIAYDDEGGGKACRLLWTLELAGHHKVSLLNGGIFAWANNGFPMEHTINHPVPADFKVNKDNSVLATLDYIQEYLDDPDIQILDARSVAEYRGTKNFAQKGGHIPVLFIMNGPTPWTEIIISVCCLWNNCRRPWPPRVLIRIKPLWLIVTAIIDPLFHTICLKQQDLNRLRAMPALGQNGVTTLRHLWKPYRNLYSNQS